MQSHSRGRGQNEPGRLGKTRTSGNGDTSTECSAICCAWASGWNAACHRFTDRSAHDMAAQPLNVGLMQLMMDQQMARMQAMITDANAHLTLKMSTEMDEVKGVVEDVRGVAERAGSTASAAMEAVRALQAKVEKGVPAACGVSADAKKTTETNQETRRQLEMVITGFPYNTPKVEIEAILADVVKKYEITTDDQFAPGPLASVGILRFNSSAHKKEFKQKLKTNGFSIKHGGRELHVGDNAPKEDKPKERAVGRVKRALMEVKRDHTDVLVLRKKGEVYLEGENGRVRVAKWRGDHLKLAGEAETLKGRIDELIAERGGRERDGLSD